MVPASIRKTPAVSAELVDRTMRGKKRRKSSITLNTPTPSIISFLKVAAANTVQTEDKDTSIRHLAAGMSAGDLYCNMCTDTVPTVCTSAGHLHHHHETPAMDDAILSTDDATMKDGAILQRDDAIKLECDIKRGGWCNTHASQSRKIITVSRKWKLQKDGLYGNGSVRKTEYKCLAKLGPSEMTLKPGTSVDISGKGDYCGQVASEVQIMGISESGEIGLRYEDKLSGDLTD